ncbi:hypothetical protein M441DRAFT_178814 [Trichoderma asperellum CBS 433.97]|uniref:Protein HRI1 n=1 Tax=Trichoderma asperellum (strain ATCC 204424 / CBS 433.97 / NBRC 101777) TaxID=1042311 RepID=A0A2T3YTD1_TRIA4|nr:hypothetical protein M441DRAFT_178814 [Trichoderma asperellum CBS 433.97]PTB35832.1 hypothetical protein M441DRAFT_178814 [Trichoderma asperellum CBS 433.97]
MASISFRKFIRWVPEEASEPTSTLVLTSPEKRFVDIRVLLPDGKDSLANNEEILPLARLDWAMAGFSSSTILSAGHSLSQWRHWIDSRAVDAPPDEGHMYAQPDGLSTLEKGQMMNPATGKDTDYEEMWFDPPPKKTGGDRAVCAVLMMEDEKAGKKGMFVRLGEWAQVFVRDGPGEGDLVAERWGWRDDDGKGWRRIVRLGDGERKLPCEEVLLDEKLKSEYRVGNEVWKVVEDVEV